VVLRCRGGKPGGCASAEVQWCSGDDMEVQKYKYKGADVQVCRYRRCSRGAKMQRYRGAEERF
jgi:hypothetical protein